jgi:hypothetical protein
MTLVVPVLLAFLVIAIAGSSLRRKGQWSTGVYVAWLAVSALLCLALAALVFLPRALSR